MAGRNALGCNGSEFAGPISPRPGVAAPTVVFRTKDEPFAARLLH